MQKFPFQCQFEGNSIVREYVFTFSKSPKRDFLRVLKCYVKKRKKAYKNNYTRHVIHAMMLQHYIKTVYFWLNNGLGSVRRTTKLTEGDHRVFRTICRPTLWAIKTRHIYFFDNSDKYWPIFVFLTAIYNNELRNKNLLKFSPYLKSSAAIPCETWNVKHVDIQQGHIQFKTDSKCQVTDSQY